MGDGCLDLVKLCAAAAGPRYVAQLHHCSGYCFITVRGIASSLLAQGLVLGLGRAPYVLYGVKSTYLVSLW